MTPPTSGDKNAFFPSCTRDNSSDGKMKSDVWRGEKQALQLWSGRSRLRRPWLLEPHWSRPAGHVISASSQLCEHWCVHVSWSLLPPRLSPESFFFFFCLFLLLCSCSTQDVFVLFFFKWLWVNFSAVMRRRLMSPGWRWHQFLPDWPQTSGDTLSPGKQRKVNEE